jgi:hypothetical protein
VTALVGWRGSQIDFLRTLPSLYLYSPVAIDLAAKVGKKLAVLAEDFEASSAWPQVHLDLIEKTLPTAAKLFRQVAIIGPQVL